MRLPVSRTLWRHVGAVWRAIAADARGDRHEPVVGPVGLRTDGGERRDGERGDRPDEADHLRDVPDGAGCTEIWEHLSDRTLAEADD